jgi:hypothetical protein
VQEENGEATARTTWTRTKAGPEEPTDGNVCPAPFGNWLRYKVRQIWPLKGARLWKTRRLLVILLALLVLRAGYVELRHGLAVRELKAEGYVRDRMYGGSFSERWHYPADPENNYVILFWYPRPDDSLFQKIDVTLSSAFSRQSGGMRWPSDAGIMLHFLFAHVTRPFLVHVDSRTGFDPNADLLEQFKDLEAQVREEHGLPPAEDGATSMTPGSHAAPE